MHTRMCRKYPITHVNIQEHPIYSNCHKPIYILKRKHTFMLKVLRPTLVFSLLKQFSSQLSFLLSMVASSHHNISIDQNAYANTKKSTPLPTPRVTTTTTNKGLELILIPGHKEECKKVWETQELLPTSLNTKHFCFAGPYPLTLDYEAISSWFPTYENEHLIIHTNY